MRLVSLNIRYGTADDGPNAWPHRRANLLNFLREQDADIYCLQEVLDFQLDEIGGALPDHQHVGVGRNDGLRGGEYAPIFYRRLTVQDSGTTWLSESPERPGSMGWGARHARICTWAQFEQFKLGNLHLDHESEEARVNSTRLVTETMNLDIVCGDFNAIPSETCIKVMIDGGYQDLGTDDGTFNGFNPAPVDAPKIDYIFARSPYTGSAHVVREPMVSDHWAVTARIEAV